MLNSKKGFTLIELVMVIVILGILAAIAVPRFIDLSTDAEKASAKGVAGSITGAANMLHAQYLLRGTAYNLGTTGSADPQSVIGSASISGANVVAGSTIAGAPTGSSSLITITVGSSGNSYTMTFTGGNTTLGPKAVYNNF